MTKDEEQKSQSVEQEQEAPKKKKLLSTWVFYRKWEDEITQERFFGTIWLVLARWLWLTAFVAYYANSIWFYPNDLMLIVWLLISIWGIYLAIKSKNPILSFVGYNLIVLPFWFELGPILDVYSPEVIQKALWMTAWIAILMWLLWSVYPNIFKKLWMALFISLLCIVIVWIVQLFVPSLDLWFIDYISAWVFSLYIGYDMYRANSVQKTYDNAIDMCVDFYLDIINLFLDLLKIMGRKK